MKKGNLLNQPLSAVVAGLGHTDTVAIVDSGYPIPGNVVRVDLAVRPGIPSLSDVLRTVLEELVVEEYYMASEAEKNSPEMYSKVTNLLGDTKLSTIPHQEFKEKVQKAKAVIRTGEQTFFANVLLVCGVSFGPDGK